jgi:hypothetical protein
MALLYLNYYLLALFFFKGNFNSFNIQNPETEVFDHLISTPYTENIRRRPYICAAWFNQRGIEIKGIVFSKNVAL